MVQALGVDLLCERFAASSGGKALTRGLLAGCSMAGVTSVSSRSFLSSEMAPVSFLPVLYHPLPELLNGSPNHVSNAAALSFNHDRHWC